MSLPATDDFAGTGALSGSWTDQALGSGNGTISRVSGEAVSSTGMGNDAFYFWNADTFDNDQYSQIIIRSIASGTRYVELTVRASLTAGSAKNYGVFMDGGSGAGHCEFQKITAGPTFTSLGAITTTLAAGDTVKLTVIGDTLTLYKNTVSVGTAAGGSAIASGSAGIGAFESGSGAGSKFDDWVGGNTTVASVIFSKNVFVSQAVKRSSYY